MALILLRLKIALQRRHRGQSNLAHALTLWGRWLVAFALGAAAGAGVAFLDSTGPTGNLPVLLIFTVFWVGWIVLPLAIPGMGDTSVDPSRLEMFPISAAQQVIGFALGGLFAPTALFTFLTASGGAFISDESIVARALVVIVAVLFALTCVVASRSVMALASSASSSRHGRDMVFVVAGVLMLGMFLLFSLAEDFLTDIASLENSTAESVLEWTPPGAFGAAILALRDADFGPALVSIGYGLVWVLGFGALWAWAIRRRVKGGGHASQARKRGHRESELALLPGAMQALNPTPAVAAFAQQFRYFFFRSPKAAQQIVAGIVGGAFIGYQTVESSGLAMGTSVFVPVMAMTLGLSTFNYDDRGYAYLMQTGARLRGILVGKVLLNWLITIVIMLVFVAIEASVNNTWDDAAAAIVVGIGITSMATGVGAVVGVTTPTNQERPGPGRFRLLVGLLGGLAVVIGLMAGFAFVFDLFGDGTIDLTTGLIALGLGVSAGGAFVWLAGNRVVRNPLAIAVALGV